jgi:hypothetical protein
MRLLPNCVTGRVVTFQGGVGNVFCGPGFGPMDLFGLCSSNSVTAAQVPWY